MNSEDSQSNILRREGSPSQVHCRLKSRRRTLLVMLCLVTGRGMAAQASQDTGLSLQGATGVLNTPNAHVQQEGTFDVLYSNQREPINGKTYPWQDNYFFSLGMFKFLEFGGRLTNNISAQTPDAIRDLSLNFKVTSAPLTARYRFSPTLAVGALDPGSGHHFFQSTYVVGSANPVSWARLSLGYGNGPDRMKGVFAGGELRAFSWATVLADYDTSHSNVGVRLTAPEIPYIHARLTATLSAPMPAPTSQHLALAGGFIIPLNFKEKAKRPEQQTLWGALTSRKSSKPAAEAQSRSVYAGAPAPAASVPVMQTTTRNNANVPVVHAATLSGNTELMSPETLRERLIKGGFVNVKVGRQGKTLVVEYENIRYNHSEMDAIGVVCGLASQTGGNGLEDLRLVVRRRGLLLLQMETGLSQLHGWLEGNAEAPAIAVTQNLTDEKETTFVPGSKNPGMLKPSIVVYPVLTTLIATEHGLFDYQLSIRPELQLPLWRGATAVARADIPVSWSPNLNAGAVYASFRTPRQLDRAMLFQTVKLAPGLVANLGAGKVLTSNNGTLNELNWIVKGGTNTFNLTQSWGRDTGVNRNVVLGTYRLQVPRYDLAVEATGGRFYAQDTGVMVSLQRFFGDTSLSIYFKDTVQPGNTQRSEQAGVRIDLPLTPRRDMKAKPIQIRGEQDWSFSQETGVVSSGTAPANYVNPEAAIIPETDQSLAVFYYDRERLNPDYILTHTARIKEAWQHFRNNL